jgi:hypothetical protein
LGWFQPHRPELFTPDMLPVFNLLVDEGRFYGFPVHGIPGFKFGKYHHLEEDVDPEEFDRGPRLEDELLLREFSTCTPSSDYDRGAPSRRARLTIEQRGVDGGGRPFRGARLTRDTRDDGYRDLESWVSTVADEDDAAIRPLWLAQQLRAHVHCPSSTDRRSIPPA